MSCVVIVFFAVPLLEQFVIPKCRLEKKKKPDSIVANFLIVSIVNVSINTRFCRQDKVINR